MDDNILPMLLRFCWKLLELIRCLTAGNINYHSSRRKILPSISVLNAFTGYDTASGIFGIGQDKLLSIQEKLVEADIKIYSAIVLQQKRK